MTMEKVIESGTVEVLRLVVGPFENNAYLLRDRSRTACVLIDAPFDAERILDVIGSHTLEFILLTHAHVDHIQALAELRRATGAPVGVHPLEPEAPGLDAEIPLSHGQILPWAPHRLEVIHTPGHTPGGVCFLLPPSVCFCGDTVFPGGPGRTWSAEGFRQIMESLETRIYTLGDSVLLLPGHGQGIPVGRSREESERFRRSPQRQGLWGEVQWDRA
jgi:glyoxylase-like metal-dependent hydrolase (beta-lactamase superfamily II)